MRRHEQDIKEIFDRSFPVPSREQAESTCERVLDRLNSPVDFSAEARMMTRTDAVRHRTWVTPLWAAAALVAFALLSLLFVRTLVLPENVYAIVETVDGSLYRVTDGKAHAVNVGERIEAGKVLRTDEGAAVLALPDGSRIEMSAESELSLEHADDGTRIHLNVGSVFVKPAKQRTGNLYLQNGEVTVPIVGALFQSTASAVQSVAEPLPTFEVASIRPSAPIAAVGNRGGPPSAGGSGPSGCMPIGVQLDPGRIIVTRATLYRLIGLAYGKGCPLPEALSGGPEWAKADRYDVEAVIPAGAPTYTRRELMEGKAPKLQAMLQNLLTDRFKLVLRREMKDMPAYNLVVAKAVKLKSSEDQTGATHASLPEALNPVPKMYTAGVSMQQYASALQGQLGRTVIDKTDAKGLYDLLLLFDGGAPPPPNAGAEFLNASLARLRDAIPLALEEQLGLKLEPARALVEVLFIDRVEKPSEN